jgi:hypothetical protein
MPRNETGQMVRDSTRIDAEPATNIEAKDEGDGPASVKLLGLGRAHCHAAENTYNATKESPLNLGDHISVLDLQHITRVCGHWKLRERALFSHCNALAMEVGHCRFDNLVDRQF